MAQSLSNTRVTRWAYTSDMYSHNGSLRLRQHGAFFSFSRKFGSQSQISVKKNDRFRPIGGEVYLPVEHRVTRVKYGRIVSRKAATFMRFLATFAPLRELI